MARHSLPWLATDCDPLDAETASRRSSGISTAAFFYPPLSPPATPAQQQRVMSAPLIPPAPRSPPPLPPHPYQSHHAASYDYHSHSHTPMILTHANSTTNTQLHPGPGRFPSAVSSNSTVHMHRGSGDVDRDASKPTLIIHHHHHHHHPGPATPTSPHPPPTPVPPPPRRTIKALLRPVLFFLFFLPLPPLLCVLYLALGHAILLRASESSPHTHAAWTAPILSSANAGAVGGAVLALPLFLLLSLLLLLLSPTRHNTAHGPPRAAHEDFFDDDTSSHRARAQRIWSLRTAAACACILLGMGAAAGPLGVACLKGAISMSMLMLSPGRAAAAGVVGALVLWTCVLAGVFFAVGVWFSWRQWARVVGVDSEHPQLQGLPGKPA
ncbi:hypothetical protein H0H81_009803 [Sphagnurus paluster]|uniref:Uncharacterized protein n=1 Tax=Sphagnurus paluster TaxID=117069 RepID=A0A9P7KG63_9AGAR|nr:hypothetical protein H0H81_009803 [Sphagnurus paluster]